MATQLRSVLLPPPVPRVDRSPCAAFGVHFQRQKSSNSLSGGKHHGTLTPMVRSSSLSSSSIASDAYISPKLSENGNDGGGSYFHGDGRGGSGGGGDHGNNGGAGPSGGGNGYGGDSSGKSGIFGAFLKGWNERVSADPQFPFKVLMEEVIGVGANVAGDMASRPNFGLNELDFVFSTIVVGSILNFSLMYMLAPTSALASAATTLPSVFRSCPSGYMFQPGAYSLAERLGTFVYKGAVFATVGFAAGLLGTSISNLLIGMRKKMDPAFVQQNKAPPTVLNAATWALHMGFSSNLRYQAVNGLEFSLAKFLTPTAFKASVFFIRAVNNVLGGMSFVVLARLTGSQEAAGSHDGAVSPSLEFKEAKVLSPSPSQDDKLILNARESEALNLAESQNADVGVGQPILENKEQNSATESGNIEQLEIPILSTNSIQEPPVEAGKQGESTNAAPVVNDVHSADPNSTPEGASSASLKNDNAGA